MAAGTSHPPSPLSSHPAPPAQADAALRAIAGFEAAKGAIALLAGAGLLSVLHRNLHQLAVALIGHVGLSPGERYPALLLSQVDLWAHEDLRLLVAAVVAYAALRFTEAWGLWRGRVWGEWLGALSGGLYIPFELWHWVHHPTWLASAVVLFNAGVVAYLGWRLHTRPAQARSGAASQP
ncbi:DUF2127 domain-containing protein [Paracidovorax konjaci]|uniref:Uncharacterized membrane protein, DUF2068 family n=1 Tax=Paracidovorax konjaci TaxID=32040 RepID=A0A1I1XHF9_9BURK|nr:DUF2127 domain-containing protein [Paracidovorax konjaci]SFE06839.1 Uncharacterized membrane protein, DUF2068 family [Paracidovorax konjaci]